jgi:hypothetical protein
LAAQRFNCLRTTEICHLCDRAWRGDNKPSKPDRVWNCIPDDIRQRVVMPLFGFAALQSCNSEIISLMQ